MKNSSPKTKPCETPKIRIRTEDLAKSLMVYVTLQNPNISNSCRFCH